MKMLSSFSPQSPKHCNKIGFLLGFMLFTFGAFQANAQTYCTPTSCCTNFYIDEVNLGSLSNNTGGSSSNGYSDFTNLTAPVYQKGNSISYSVLGSSFGNLAIWVDWDNDGDFSGSNEKIINLSMSSNPETGSFTVPNSAATGNLRVRVMFESGSISDPCSNTFGETEDYNIFIDLPAGEDAAITSINEPSTSTSEGGCDLTSNETVDVTVNSVKGTDIDSVPVNYQINKGSIVQDTVYSNISGGSSQNFTFGQTADLSANDSTYEIKVWTDYAADTIPNNDTLTKIVNQFGVIDGPYLETFEGESSCSQGSCASNGACALSGQWVNGMLNDDMDWSVKRGPTETSNSGPVYDHTVGVDFFPNGFDLVDNVSGSYLFTEANGCNNSTAHLMSYCMNANQFDSAYLSFWYHMYGNDMGSLEVQVDTGGSWNTIWSVSGEQQTSSSDPWEKGEVTLPQSGVYNIRFAGNTGGNDNSDIALDDIRIDNYTACEAPSDLEVMDYSPDSVKVAWTPGDSVHTNWSIQYDTSGFALSQGMTTNASDSSAWLTGLGGDSAEYEFYVQENCANNDTSYWSTSETFTPDCDPVQDTLIEQDWNVPEEVATVIPYCWTSLIELDDPYKIGDYASTLWNDSDPSFFMNNSGQTGSGNFIALVSRPILDLTSNARKVTFDARAGGSEELIIGTMSNRADTSTFQAHDTIPASDLNSGSLKEYSIPLVSVPSGHKYLVFKHGATNAGGVYVYIDNVEYTHLPDCDAPSNLTVDSMRHDSAWVSWNSGEAPDNEWYIEYGQQGFSPGNGTAVSGITDSSYAISGLTEASDYDVYVREQCDSSSFSQNIGPANFTTPCRVREAGWHENFARGSSGFSTYPCWNFIETGNVSVSLESAGPNGAPPHPVAGTHMLNIWRSGSGNGLVVSPELSDLDERINQVRFHANADEPLPSQRDTGSIIVGTMTDQNNASTFTPMDSVLITADDNWYEYKFWLHHYNVGDGKYLALKMGGYPREMYLDSIVYETIPDCSVGLYADTINGWAREGAYGFNGEMNEGTMSAPDTTCMGDSATFDLTAPYGYDNSDHGSEWNITSVTAATPSGVGVTAFNKAPSGGDNAEIGFIPNAIVEDSIVKVDVDVEFSTLGCDTTLTRYVLVAPSSTADFSFDDNLCAKNDINLINNSTNVTTASTFNWSFEDGTTSNAVNPQKSFNSGGEYEIQLDVTNKYGCTDDFTDTVDVNYNPDVGYTRTASEVCLGESIDFTDTTVFNGSSNLTRNWDFGDGNNGSGQNVNHTYTGSGSYEVTLTVNSDEGCADSMSKTVVVNDTPNVAFNVQDTCAGNEVHFTNNSSIANGNLDYTWHFDDGNTSSLQEPDPLYDSAGNYDVKLVAEGNGCVDSVTKSVTIHHTPRAGFTKSKSSVCLGESLTFIDTSEFGGNATLDYTWKFGDNDTSPFRNPTYSYTEPGNHFVTLVTESSEGCVDSTTKVVTVHDTPTVDFNAPQICAGGTVEFSNNSGIAGGNLNYTWHFEDGSTSGLVEPNRTYNMPDEYDVKLVATSNNSCADSVTKAVTVNELPEAGFTAPDVCEGSATSFTDTSSIGSGSIMAYQWDFGDGKGSINADPAYRYDDTGDYEVQLVVTSDEVCRDTAQKMVRVNPVPDAAFVASDVCFGDTVEFMNQSQYGGDNGLKFTWDFGDNDTSAVKDPDHVYNQAGDYTVELAVEDSVTGCMNKIQRQINIYEQPEADFSVSSVCEGGDLSISDETQFDGNGFLNYEYAVNGNTLDGGRNPVISNVDTGTYNISLTVSTSSGCMSTHDTMVEVTPTPDASFNAPARVCAGESVSFTNNTTYKGDSDSLTYAWDFGNGESDTTETPDLAYSEAGTYEVTLEVISTNGCMDSATSTVDVAPALSSEFDFTIENYETVSFEAEDTTGIKYEWEFGDGSSAEGMNTSHVYQSNGEYEVSLTVYNNNGCTSTSVDTVEMDRVSIESEEESNISFSAFPNPFQNDVTIEYELDQAAQVDLQVYNNNGKVVETIVSSNQQNAGTYSYEFSGASAGTYFVRLVIDGELQVKKLVKSQ